MVVAPIYGARTSELKLSWSVLSESRQRSAQAFTMLLIRRTLRATSLVTRSISTLHPEPHVATDRILSCQATAEALALWDEGRHAIDIRAASEGGSLLCPGAGMLPEAHVPYNDFPVVIP